MNLLLGSLLTAYLLAFLAYCAWDIWAECEWQTGVCEREELLDELWADEEAGA